MASPLESTSSTSPAAATSPALSPPPPGAAVPSRASRPQRWVELVARAVRVAVDLASLVAFYDAWHVSGGALRVIVAWMISLVVFPYSSMADRVRQQREVPRALLVTGLLLVGIGAASRFNLFGLTLRHYAPAGDTLWLGIAMAFAGAARGRARPDTSAPASVWYLAFGVASIVSGAIWVWLALARN